MLFLPPGTLFPLLFALTSTYPSDIRANATSQALWLITLRERHFFRALRALCFSSHGACCHCHFPVCLNERVTKILFPQPTGQCLFMPILTLNPQDLVSAWYERDSQMIFE